MNPTTNKLKLNYFSIQKIQFTSKSTDPLQMWDADTQTITSTVKCIKLNSLFFIIMPVDISVTKTAEFFYNGLIRQKEQMQHLI